MCDVQQSHFEFLAGESDEVFIEICKLALEYLKEGANPEKYAAVGERLNKSPDFIQHVVESVLFFLIQTVAQVANLETANNYGLSDTKLDILTQFLQKQHDTITKLLESDTNTLHFRDLEWRIETRVASRALLHQMVPQISLKLHLDHQTLNENKEKLVVGHPETPIDIPSSQRQVVMQLDPGNLRSIIESIDKAILESKTHRTRVFCRRKN